MAENKTKPTNVSVSDFINKVENEQRRNDAKALLKIMQEETGEKPHMWGPSIIGFGEYHYKYESGREGDMCKVGFSPRKPSISLYIIGNFPKYENLITKLGKFKKAVACIYVKKLSDLNEDVLREMIRECYNHSNFDVRLGMERS